MCPFETLGDTEPDQEGTEKKPEFESITGPQSETEYIRQILRKEIQGNPEALQTGIEMESLEKNTALIRITLNGMSRMQATSKKPRRN